MQRSRPDLGAPGPGYVPPKFDPPAGHTVKLSRPIEGHGGLISELHFRPPTFGDWVEIGDFETTEFILDEATGNRRGCVRVTPEAVARWFQRLTALPSSVLAQMAFSDGQACYRKLQELMTVVGTLGNPPTSPGSSGGSAA